MPLTRTARWALLLVSLSAAGLAGATRDLFAPDPYMRHVRQLASDDLRGRGNGTPELERAAEYIAAQFRAAGLQPGGTAGSWFQPFDLVTGLNIGEGNVLRLRGGNATVDLEIGRTYYPLSAAAGDGRSPASLERVPLVFGGYGISAPDLRYDDYASIDVKGKAVLAFTHEPQETNADSVFNGAQLSKYSTLLEKSMAARNHGAAMLIVVSDPTHDRDAGAYEGFAQDPQADNYGVPVLRVERSAVEPLLAAWGLDAVAREIDVDLAPRSRPLPDATADYTERLTRIRSTVRNVVGVLQGSDPARASEAVVVGAHYDHLGLGGRSAMNPDLAGQIHNGADDNASGTAAIIEMARVAAGNRERFPRTMVFIAFAGEEIGLLGSAHYVANPTLPLEQTVAMLNLDMVGRANGQVMVSGLDTAPSLSDEMDAAAAEAQGLAIKRFAEGAGVGASDDTSFALKQIPAIGFFSGFHADYHRPGDDWEKVDASGAVEVMTVAYELAARIADGAERPAFVAREAPGGHGSAAAGSGVGGYGAYFGSVPDFGQSDAGVRFSDVRPEGPAGKAGLLAGDVLVEFAGKPIKTLIDFTFALRQHNPGESIEVKYVRDGRTISATVLLTTRP
ncbi:MAG: M28 family peptidase [Acidimicrobiia bacterium]|nr:M28 family peptidase [Acidimicrobiia bacterium]